MSGLSEAVMGDGALGAQLAADPALAGAKLRESIIAKGQELRLAREAVTRRPAGAGGVEGRASETIATEQVDMGGIGEQTEGLGEAVACGGDDGGAEEGARARVLLSELLDLKAQYLATTGEEYRKSSRVTKRERAAEAERRAKKRQRGGDGGGGNSEGDGGGGEGEGGDGAAHRGDGSASGADRVRQRVKQPRISSSWGTEAAAAVPDVMALPPAAETFAPYSPPDFFKFEVLHVSRKPGSRARVGRITTPHGVIETPAFVPVGTNAALKAVDERQSIEAGTQLMFCNTYHLLVHPGPEIVRRAGGLHKYMNHRGAIITDSGGFQVFSLAEPNEEDGPEMKSRAKRVGKEGSKNSASLLRIGERGALFRSYHDGSSIELTPESSVAAQKSLGSDIIIPLDELPPYHVTRERLQQSVRLSHRWMARSLRAHLADQREQAMYAVIHGGTDQQLRQESAEYLSSLPFDGFAIGGSLGKDRAEMLELLDFLMPLLPNDKPNHLLGIADPESAEAVVPFGIDTMDSCNPTRIARHGLLLCTTGPVKIKQARYLDDFSPIDPDCETIPYSRSYLHHLFKQHEPLFMTLASQHNLIFMHKLMAQLRKKILNDEI